MEFTLTDQKKMIVQLFFLILLPWILILIGLIVPIENVWYYLLAITWFGSGIIFLGALN